MSFCLLLSADVPLPEVHPSQEYPLHIDLDRGTVEDGGADDNFSLWPFPEAELYTSQSHAMELECHLWTPGRARLLQEYIRQRLQETSQVCLWAVWLSGCPEEERPILKTATVDVDALTVEDFRQLAEVSPFPDRNHDRPTHYCLRIVRSGGGT